MTRTVLLGGGASVEAGVPSAVPMARSIVGKLSDHERVARAINVAIGGLRLAKSHAGQPYAEIDVEELFECLRILGNRGAQPLSPFVGSWIHAVNDAERPDIGLLVNHVAEQTRALAAAYARPPTRGRIDPPPSAEALNSALYLLMSAGADRPSAFQSAADRVLAALIRACWIDDPSNVAYLAALLPRQPEDRVWVASLNYDNSVELAASTAGVTLELGIQPDGSVSLPRDGVPGAVCLAKLHGSVDWSYDQDRVKRNDAPMAAAALIFGASNKLRIEGPYLDLLLAFRARLQVTEQLFVCGYSFRDQHVNHLLLGWLKGNRNRVLSVCEPSLSAGQLVRNVVLALPEGMHLSEGHLEARMRIRAEPASVGLARLTSGTV
jgi:hypothetical protein